ncbi:DUF2510 domain-containing protein [Mycolicibacterium sp. Y3]
MTAPGWYPDPLGGQGARYWDGAQWEGAINPDPQEFPESPPPTETVSRRIWPVWAGLAATVAIAIGSAVFVLTRPTPNVPTAAPISASTTAARIPTPAPTEAVAGEVKSAMQRKLDGDPDLKNLTVVEVRLVHKAGNEYKGIATVKAADDTKHDVPVDVTADDENVLWESPPGAFAFAESRPSPPPAPRPPAPRPPPPPPLGPGVVEDFRLCPSGLTGVASAETSCAFADNVRQSWYGQPGSVITAYSPVTGRLYTMRCAAANTTAWPAAQRCTGTNPQGDPLIVYIS